MNYRFMTGWKLEGSNNNSSFIELDSRDMDLCTTTNSNEACANDCGAFTSREFDSIQGFYRYFRFSMTKMDSCDSKYLRLSGFDLFGVFDYRNCQFNSCKHIKSGVFLIQTIVINLLMVMNTW